VSRTAREVRPGRTEISSIGRWEALRRAARYGSFENAAMRIVITEACTICEVWQIAQISRAPVQILRRKLCPTLVWLDDDSSQCQTVYDGSQAAISSSQVRPIQVTSPYSLLDSSMACGKHTQGRVSSSSS